ncbi:MAG: hypothetical protein F9K46_06490 [Anaerolineae bacterium]|nr:MAG: hypothetical protein F9K46_06490 [Anaerolineae bacterium]
MTHEKPQPYRRPAEVFGLTDHEKLWDRLSDQRFQTLLNDPQTEVHEVQVDTNSYGEFLFVQMSRVVDSQRYGLTTFGLGFHEYREQWITQHWHWYESHPSLLAKKPILPKTEALQLIQNRRDEIAPHVTNTQPSKIALLFGLLADLSDEDGALAELDDLGDFLDLFDDE